MSTLDTLRAAATHARDRWAPDMTPDAGPVRRAAQAATVITVVVIGVVALVGILIFDSVYTSIPTDSVNGTALEGTPDQVLGGFSNALELIPIVLLVLIAALVISVVQRMRQR